MLIANTRTILGILAMGFFTACATPQAGSESVASPAVPVASLGLVPGDAPSATAAVAPHIVKVRQAGSQLTLGLQEVPGVSGAVFLTSPPGDRNRQFIVERAGRIHIVQNGVLLPTPFLDINERVLSQREGGLLSMAFDPGYASNGYFFLAYSDKMHRLVVERRRVSSDPNLAEYGSELVILRIWHFNTTHYGGTVSFGPDGYLYLSTGDDGGTGDPFGNGQNLNSLLGKVLRVDVGNASAAERYRVPPSNPFVGQSGRRWEIWAYGLRNPWRYSFDAGLLYLSDVGQDRREEINVTDAAQGGINYGWNIMEGTLCYDAPTCNQAGLTLPAFEYDHVDGCSVIGGYVYRGTEIPELAGHYFYSDFCRGFLRSFLFSEGRAGAHADWPTGDAGRIQSFGRDADGELYLIAASGRIFRLVKGAALTAAVQLIN